MDWQTVASVGALLVAGLSLLRQKRKDDVDIADSLADMAVALVQPLKERIAETEKRLSEVECDNDGLRKETGKLKRDNERLRRENDELWRGVLLLLKQMSNHEISPHWTPTDKVLARYGFMPGDFGRQPDGKGSQG